MYKCDNCKCLYEEFGNEETDSPNNYCSDCLVECLECQKKVGICETTRGYCESCSFFCEVCSQHIGFAQTLSYDNKCYQCYITSTIKNTRVLTSIPDYDLKEVCSCKSCVNAEIHRVSGYCRVKKRRVRGGETW